MIVVFSYSLIIPLYAEDPPASLATPLDPGIRLLNENRLEDAIKAFEEVLVKDPKEHMAQYYIGLIYHLKGQPVEALSALNKALELSPGMPRALLRIGIILEEIGRLDPALDAYRSLAQQEEDIPEVKEARERFKNLFVTVHYRRAARLFQERRYEEVIKELQMVLSLAPEYTEALFAQGMAYLRLSRAKEAIESFKKVTDINPGHLDAHIYLGLTYEAKAAYQEAIESFKKVISLAPGSPQAIEAEKRLKDDEKRIEIRQHFEDVAKMMRSERWGDALKEAEIIVTLEPQNPNSLFNLGLILHRLQRSEEAIDTLKKSIEVDPRFQKGRYQLAVVYDDLGRFDEALEVYEQMLTTGVEGETVKKAEERITLLRSVLGGEEAVEEIKELLEKKDIAGAIQKVESLITQKPEDVLLITTLGKLYLRAGRHKDAITLLEKAVNLIPQNVEIRLLLALMYEITKEYSRAIDLYRTVALQAGVTPIGMEAQKKAKALALPYHFSEARRLGEKGDYEGALQEIQDLLAIHPDHPVALFNLGVLYYRLNQYDKGEPPLRQAITLAPDYAEAYFQLGLILEGLRRYDEAIDIYKKTIEIKKEGREARLAMTRIAPLEEYQGMIGYFENGLKLMDEGKWGDARKELEAALAIKPRNYLGYYYLGIIHEQLGIPGEARAAYKKAIEINPRFVRAYMFLAALEISEMEFEEARKAYMEVIALGEDTPEAEGAIIGLKRLRALRVSLSLNNNFNSNITFRAKPQSTVQSGYGLGVTYSLVRQKEVNLSVGLSGSENIYYNTQLQGNGYTLSLNGRRQFIQERSISGGASQSKSFFEGELSTLTTRYFVNASTQPRAIPTSGSIGYDFTRTKSYRNKASDSDGHNLSASLSQKFSPLDTVSGSYSIHIYKNLDPVGSNYANRTNTISFNYARSLFFRLEGNLGYSISFINYSNPDSTTLFQQLRQSNNQRLNAGISLNIPGDITFSFDYGFSYAIDRTNLPGLTSEERQKLEDILATPIPTVGGNNMYYQHRVGFSISASF